MRVHDCTIIMIKFSHTRTHARMHKHTHTHTHTHTPTHTHRHTDTHTHTHRHTDTPTHTHTHTHTHNIYIYIIPKLYNHLLHKSGCEPRKNLYIYIYIYIHIYILYIYIYTHVYTYDQLNIIPSYTDHLKLAKRLFVGMRTTFNAATFWHILFTNTTSHVRSPNLHSTALIQYCNISNMAG